MEYSRDDLLRPSLSDTPIAKAPYSVTTTFVTSFFGGPFAAIGILTLNSIRLSRVSRDFLPIALIIAVYIGLLLGIVWTEWGAVFQTWLTDFAGRRGMRLFVQVVGIVVFALGYALHRKEQRSADFMGLDRPNGWIGGIACIILGIILQVALSMFAIGVPK